jgi:hypothetical protein
VCSEGAQFLRRKSNLAVLSEGSCGNAHLQQTKPYLLPQAKSYRYEHVYRHFRTKNDVFWDVTPCGFVRIDVSEELRASIIRVARIDGLLGTKYFFVFLRSLSRLLVSANVVPSSPILVTLIMEALGSSETSVLTRAPRRNIPEDAILHSHRRGNLKSYIALTGWTL